MEKGKDMKETGVEFREGRRERGVNVEEEVGGKRKETEREAWRDGGMQGELMRKKKSI